MKVNGWAVAALGGGVLLFWSGFTGRGVLASVQTVIQGKAPSVNPQVNAPQDVAPTPLTSADFAGTPLAGSNVQNPGSESGNKALGHMLATAYGWGSPSELSALDALWTRESNWDNTAQNPSSGAYGIAQALPYSKMPKAAWPPHAGGSASASAQISWGLSYIKQRYGDPIAAEAHEQSAGWY